MKIVSVCDPNPSLKVNYMCANVCSSSLLPNIAPLPACLFNTLVGLLVFLDTSLLLFFISSHEDFFTNIPLNIFEIMYISHWRFLECKEVGWYESILDFLGT